MARHPLDPVRLVAISDTHGFHDTLELPDGDVLIHAGDFSRRGTREEFDAFAAWFAAQPHPHKLLVAGNHDRALERDLEGCRAALPAGITWLHDSGVELLGLRFWGTPWTPIFFDWAFMKARGPEIAERWAQIPAGVDVLITHGPPYGHGDLCARPSGDGPAAGCLELTLALRRVRPQLHLFGHIHEGYGITASQELPGTRFVNASTCTVEYAPSNPPVELSLRPRSPSDGPP